MKSLKRLLPVVILLLLAILIPTQSALASNYNVTCAAGTAGVISAINSANTDGVNSTINLESGCTYIFTAANNTFGGAGGNALPAVVNNGSLTINGGSGATLERSSAGGTPEFRFFYLSDANLTLSNVTLKRGLISGGNWGGAIFNSSSTLNLNNSTLRDNTASDGGAFYSNASSTTYLNTSSLLNNAASNSGAGFFTYGTVYILSGSTVSGNTASGDGGGFYSAPQAIITLNNSTVSNNTSSFSDGGGFRNEGTVSIVNGTFTGNMSQYDGAGFNTSAGTVSVEGSTFSNNVSTLGNGGAFSVTGGTADVTGSIFNGNTGAWGGAILNFTNGTTTISTSSFYDNVGFSGGVFYNRGSITITRSSLFSNDATTNNTGSGGAFYNYQQGTVTINNSTLHSNTATSTGGGFYNEQQATVNLTNTTIVSNTSVGTGTAFHNLGFLNMSNTIIDNNLCTLTSGMISGSHNLIETPCSVGGISGSFTNTITADAKLGTLTGSPGYFPLLNGSPAIDAGNNTAALNANLGVDQPGQLRFANDAGIVNTGSGTAPIVDIGAFEKQTNGPPQITINNVTLSEGNSATKAFNFTVSLSHASEQTVSVTYATGSGTATAGSDYTAVPATVLSFTSGQTSKQITVLVNGDITHETHENFDVNLSSPTNATISDSLGVGLISNDDSKPVIRINDTSRNEGGIGVQTNMPFTITLSNPTYQTVTVQFFTSDGTATTADSDYAPFGLTTLTFNPGVTTRNVTVKINGDAKYELYETLDFNLTNPVNASIADNRGIGTIVNDDTQPTISVNDVSRVEGNSGTTNFPFVITLSNPSYQVITVSFATSNGTATAGTDYTARSGSVSFTPGVTTRNITVVGNGDTVFEPNETFNFTLSAAVNATIADTLGIGTISNDDAAGLSEEGVQIVPVAPELPQMEAVAPVMPDAPSAQLPSVVLVSPIHPTNENPVAFTWIGTADAVEYRLLVQAQSDRSVVVDQIISAGSCNGNICVAIPAFTPVEGVVYVWTVTPITASGAGTPSAEASFSYSASAPTDEITLPGGVIIPGGQ